MAIQYRGIQGPDVAATQRGWSGIVDSIRHARDEKRRREARAAQLLLQREQLEAQKDRWKRADEQKTADRELEREQGKRMAEYRDKSLDQNAERIGFERTRLDEQRKQQREVGIQQARADFLSGKDSEDEYRRRLGTLGITQFSTAADDMPVESLGTMDRGQAMGALGAELVNQEAAQERQGGVIIGTGPDGQRVVADPEGFRQRQQDLQDQERQRQIDRVTAMFSDMENSDPRVAQAHDVLSRRMEAGLDPEKAVSDYVDSMDRIRNEDNRLTAARLRKRGRGRGGRGFAPSEVTGKAPSGPERKADLFARRMTSAYAGVQKLGDFSLDGAKKVRQWMARSHMPGYEIAENLGAVDTLEESLSPRDRLVLNEYKDFMAAQLRLLSGAAIGQHEFKNLGERIIPGIADNQDDRKQKMRMMRDMVMGVANESYRPSYYKEQLDQSESEQRNPVVRAAKAGANRNSRGARKLSESERDADDMDFIGM